jgi:catecholate siderophore receptor
MPSWRGALVFKPVAGASIYFDYGTSFNPSAETLALTVAPQDAPPEESRTLEVGTKWDLFARRLSLGAAAFRTDKTNARETVNATTVTLSGSQRVSGVQLQANGYINNQPLGNPGQLRLPGRSGHTLTCFPTLSRRSTGQCSPEHLSTWNTFQLPWCFSMGGGADFVDSRTASSTTLSIQSPAWSNRFRGIGSLTRWRNIR